MCDRNNRCGEVRRDELYFCLRLLTSQTCFVRESVAETRVWSSRGLFIAVAADAMFHKTD